jgi:hypothetical protein
MEHQPDPLLHLFFLFIAILFGVFLYWLRRNYLVLYGIGEIIVALLLLYFFFFPEGPDLLAGGWLGYLGPTWGWYPSRAVTLFGGLYALVRGLDNVNAMEKWNRVKRQVSRSG